MTKEGEMHTEIKLIGSGVEDFLHYKGVTQMDRDVDGNAIVARFRGSENCVESSFGRVGVEFGLVNFSRNRAVILFNSGLRKRGSRSIRKVSINHGTGIGVQQLTDCVMIVVKTNAGSEDFDLEDR